MDDESPQSANLRELLEEMRGGFALYAPVLIKVSEGVHSFENTVDRTVTMSEPLDWAEHYTREYANEAFVILGPNNLASRGDRAVTIGRSRRCDAKLDNDSISKVHASIAFDRSSGEYFLTDENSTNGTCINGETVKGGERAPIWPGAYVSFGDAVYVFIDPPTLRKLSKLAV